MHVFNYKNFNRVEGWIDTSGNWYECEHYDHNNFALDHFDKDEDQLIDEGWCKVYCSMFDHTMDIGTKNYTINEAQEKTLIGLGFNEKYLQQFLEIN